MNYANHSSTDPSTSGVFIYQSTMELHRGSCPLTCDRVRNACQDSPTERWRFRGALDGAHIVRLQR